MYHKNSVYVTLMSVSQIHLKRENSVQRYLIVIAKKTYFYYSNCNTLCETVSISKNKIVISKNRL